MHLYGGDSMAQASGTFSMRIDPALKQQASQLFNDLGIDLSAAISLFLKQSVAEQGMPFQPSKETHRERDIARLLLEIEQGHQDKLQGDTFTDQEVRERFGLD